jgi:hypothetical protein
MGVMAGAVPTKPRTRRPKKTTWRWRVVYRPKPGAPKKERVVFTREEAEQLATGLPAAATDVQVVHVDHAGWRTLYPIRPVESST